MILSISANSTTITLTWGPPDLDSLNGVLVGYHIQCSNGRRDYSQNVTSSQNTTTISGLQPFNNYSCNITARNIIGEGPAATANLTTEQDGV